ncbi:MAG: hypothetical protein DRJ65_11055 [Acidobacteria bacterium]|nr:MAG: hypothetical protein DRJ65_11055 [Acidobacteriota bacterium]
MRCGSETGNWKLGTDARPKACRAEGSDPRSGWRGLETRFSTLKIPFETGRGPGLATGTLQRQHQIRRNSRWSQGHHEPRALFGFVGLTEPSFKFQVSSFGVMNLGISLTAPRREA